MKLREYLEAMLPTLEVGIATKQRYSRGISRINEWFGRELDLSDVTPAMIARFREVDCRAAGNVRQLMATHDPVAFKPTRRVKPKTPKRPCSAAAIYLWNVYETRYQPTALRSRANNTKRLYRTTLKVFDEFLGRDATLDDLNDDTANAFAAWRLERVSKFSVNKDLFNLLAFWRWCFRKSLVTNWPDVEMEKAPKRSPVAWLESEIIQIYKAFSELDGKVGRINAADWWTALLLVAWDTGERIGAIINLDWSNVDLRKKWVRFPAEDRKGGQADSSVRLSDDAVAALGKIQAAEGPVFPWPYGYTYLWRRYGEILEQAGLPSDHRSKFHRIRKSVASHAEARGANATAMLRHSKREVTEAYLDPRIVTKQQPADVLFRLTT